MAADPPRYPEIPYPFPPEREPLKPVSQPAVPMVDFPGGPLSDRLAEQRKILVNGPLDLEAVTRLSAQLMTFDGASARDVEVVVNSSGGPVAEIFAVLDVIDLMRARVNVTCVGSAVGTAAVLVACGSGERRAARNATFSLRSDDPQRIDGTTGDIVRLAEQLVALRGRYVTTLAAATGLDERRIAAEIDAGTLHTATEAKDMGIIDVIIEPRHAANRP